MSEMKIAGACLNQTPIDWYHNTKNIVDAIQQAKREYVALLCLPELCITSYGCQDLFLSKWVVEEALQQLKKIIPYCHNITVAVGLPILHHGKCFNTTCLISNQQILGFYAKQILANEGIHYETRWFAPWQTQTIDTILIDGVEYLIGDLTFRLPNIHIGIEICEDAWHDHRSACRLPKRGVDLILNPSASHFTFDKYQTRVELVASRSRKFRCYYLYVNQLGNESGRVIYDGDILVAHQGDLLASQPRLSFRSFELLSLSINTASHSKQVLAISYLSRNQEFAKATALGLFDYLRKSKAKGYTLSLSGGADSSSIAILVAELVKYGIEDLGVAAFLHCLRIESDSLGLADKSMMEIRKAIVNQILFTAYQGTIHSSSDTLHSAQALAESIGAQFASWEIDEIVSTNHHIIESVIGRPLSWDKDDIALQNIQARSRSPLIWMMANIHQSILLTTSNRSEGDLGYTTMDGDTSGSLAPIAGIDKPFVLQWLQYAETELGYSGLHTVNRLTPTAELRPASSTQTDEDDLMPYDLLLAIEQQAIYKRASPVEVFHILKVEEKIPREQLKDYIKKFFKMWAANQWKRERLAPSFHLDTFNVDPKSWCRFPILSGSFDLELQALDSM